MSDKETEDRGMTRLSFIKASAGAAAGVAAISVPGAAVAHFALVKIGTCPIRWQKQIRK